MDYQAAKGVQSDRK